jgi:formate dehydrogenase subunit delta
MSPDKLVYMANQIARFFAYQPEAEAAANTADHLRKFWDPRMRREIVQYVGNGGAGLQPVAVKAVLALEEG